MTDLGRIPNRFMLSAIQEWGQPERDRIAAVQEVLDAAGFSARATCSPVFGGIWPKPCEGRDGKRATEWLKDLTKTMPRGKYERELEHVEKAIHTALSSHKQQDAP